MSTEICKITFEDGSWIKAELPVDFAARIDYVLDQFGMFSQITRLGDADAAVRSAHAKQVKRVKAAIEKHTGRKLPASAVRVSQYAFRVEAFDADGICVFSDHVSSQSDELYRLGVDMHGLMLVTQH
jgi:hypothetical protein